MEGCLNHLDYALLGLGDTNYTNFCGFPRAVNRQLERLGARKIYRPAWADDAVGLEETVDPWIDGLWPALIARDLYDDEQDRHPATEPTAPDDTSAVSEQVPLPMTNQVVEKGTSAEMPTIPTLQVEETKPNDQGSLTQSPPELSGQPLKIPALPQAFLELTFDPDLCIDTNVIPLQNGSPLPSASGPLVTAGIRCAKVLTSSQATKTALEITVDLTNSLLEYQPGDSIGVVCPNTSSDIEALLERLELLDRADVPFRLSVRPELAALKMGSKLKYLIPPHLPQQATLRHVLTHCCEIRSVPRKAMMRLLAHHATDEDQQRRLLELCSLQGAEDYGQWVRRPNIDVLDLMDAFPSCRPPIERLLEHWPRLQPRPYSISSSPLRDPTSAAFVFNVVEFPLADGRCRSRKGVATGWLQDIVQPLTTPHEPLSSGADVVQSLGHLRLDDPTPPLRLYLRTNTNFRMPADVTTPLILIGPGTGVAPFIGFLQEREQQMRRQPQLTFGPIWLLHGCRTPQHDFLYGDELKRLHEAGILTRFLLCFSRHNQPPEPRYVQDLIRVHQKQLVRLLEAKNGVLYVCGDANNMAKDVMCAVQQAFQTVQQIDETQAKSRILQLQQEKRYLQDIWT